MIIEPIGIIESAASMGPLTDTKANGSTFLSYVQNMDTSVKAADKAIADYIFKKNLNTHELMITLETAKHHLQVAVEVRNKLVSAYETVTRMGV